MPKDKGKKTVRIFSLASFFQDLGSDMIYPIWPLFVTTVLHANMEILGLIDGLGDAIVSISQAGSGYLSDRLRKRKVFIWMGYLFGSVSRIGYAFSTTWQHLIPFRILDRSGKIRGSPRDAIIADISTKRNRGSNFGELRAMDNFGAVCGIISCILLFGYLGFRNLFLLASIPSLISVILVIAFVKERKTKGIYKGLSLRSLSFNFKLFLFSSALFSVGFFSYSFLLVYAGGSGFDQAFIPVLYLIYNIVAALMSFPFGRLADRLNRKIVMIISYSLFALMCLGFIYLKTYYGVILSFVFYGLHLASKEPVQRAFVCELSPTKYRASTLGAFLMVNGLCALPASLIAGFLWDNFESVTPFYFSLLMSLASLVMLLFVKDSKACD